MKQLIKAISFGIVLVSAGANAQSKPVEVDVVIAGGFETVRVDRGRPVVLIAAALGVKDEVFRDAFSRVHPTPPGVQPDRERVDQNKRVLLDALGRYGITNDRLDEVSNYYRYRPGPNEVWRHRDAKITVTMLNGAVQKIVVTDAGAGYSSKPVLSVPGYANVQLEVVLAYGKKLETNGSIASVKARGKQFSSL